MHILGFLNGIGLDSDEIAFKRKKKDNQERIENENTVTLEYGEWAPGSLTQAQDTIGSSPTISRRYSARREVGALLSRICPRAAVNHSSFLIIFRVFAFVLHYLQMVRFDQLKIFYMLTYFITLKIFNFK